MQSSGRGLKEEVVSFLFFPHPYTASAVIQQPSQQVGRDQRNGEQSILHNDISYVMVMLVFLSTVCHLFNLILHANNMNRSLKRKNFLI